MKSPTRKDLEAAANAYFDELIAEVDQPRQSDGAKLDFAYQFHQSEQLIRQQEAELAAHDYDDHTVLLARAMVERLDLGWEALPSDIQLLAKSFIVRARRQQMRYFLHSLETPWQMFRPDDELFDPWTGPKVANRQDAAPTSSPLHSTAPGLYRYPELSLERACMLYLQCKTEQGWGASMKDESLRVLGWLNEEVGATTPMEAITRDQVREFRDCLLRLGTLAQGRKLPLRQRIAPPDGDLLSFATRERYWRFATGFYQWFASERDVIDPSRDLQFKGGKDEVKKSPCSVLG